MNVVTTIGYEGASPERFDEALKAAGVDTVIDVRAVAVSRRKGFSKTALCERLMNEGISYVHLRGLGDPKPGREAARAGNTRLFKSIFEAHLKTDEAIDQLAVLARAVREQRVALLCYEADPEGCHRTIVAEKIAKGVDLRIVHLRVESGDASKSRPRADNNTRKGLAAA